MGTATLAAGCFWGVEAAFRRVEGVTRTEVGYTGGDLADPTYEAVCAGRTGHAEAVRVEFDEAQVSYERLLEMFWSIHDPTQVNRQGPDVGTQYRSAIFFTDAEQEAAARASQAAVQARLDRPVATEITPAAAFWRAEEYHQQYLAKRGQDACASTVRD
ncbi:MAG: peptide-methionine (S)-S-oxide reductase MsrA [Planctomycetota bacterium]